MGEILEAFVGAALREPYWPKIGLWMANQPIVGEVGAMPPGYRPWYSYVVLPQPKVSFEEWRPDIKPERMYIKWAAIQPSTWWGSDRP